jgi:hypothetical protein
MTLSPELLNAIEAGCDCVTPGPWSIRHDTCAECSRRGAAEYDIPELPGGYHASIPLPSSIWSPVIAQG